MLLKQEKEGEREIDWREMREKNEKKEREGSE